MSNIPLRSHAEEKKLLSFHMLMPHNVFFFYLLTMTQDCACSLVLKARGTEAFRHTKS